MAASGLRALCVILAGGLVSLAVMAGAQESSHGQGGDGTAPQAKALMMARCAVCHSLDLIAQQRLSQQKWGATVDKMRHWGAELTDEEALELVTYLAGHYSPSTPEPSAVPETMAPGASAPLNAGAHQVGDRPAGKASRGAKLFSTNCQACHGSKASGGVGPKLSGNPIVGDNDRFWDTVLHGRGAMPPWEAALRAQDIADIHAWLHSLQD